jgi:sucrose-6-phosphate hydrolase SacC (GH32 family)
MGWVQVATPGAPFNQTFSFPHELTLRTTGDGVRMFAEPVPEIERLHREKHSTGAAELSDGSPAAVAVTGDLFDVRAMFELVDAKQVGLDIGGNRVVYDVAKGDLNGAAMKPLDGKVTMQVLVDRPVIEICGNRGRVFITAEREMRGEVGRIEAFATGGNARLVSLEAYELASIWRK